MDFQLYQIIIVIVGSYMIVQGARTFLNGKKGQTFFKLSVRVIVWGGMIGVALFPTISNDVAKFIGIQGNVNAVILTGFLLVFLMIFKLLSAIERLEQQITTLTRDDALGRLKRNDTKE